MPPIECGGYLLAYFWEVGPTEQGGMGPAVISNQEIAAWQALTGVPLQPWEARLLRRLSVEYLSESGKASKRGAPAPWNAEDALIDKVVDNNATRDAIRGLAAL